MWDFRQYGENIAWISQDGRQATYGDLDWMSKTWCEKIPQKSLVVILCENTLGSLLTYLFTMQGKSVPILLPKNIDSLFLQNIMEQYRPNYLCIPQGMAEVFGMEKVFQVEDYFVLAAYSDKVELDENLALLLSTSGSTGSPKFVRQSKENVISNALSIMKYLHIDQTERAITTMPMHYTYGLSIIHSHLMAGASIVVTKDSLFSKDFWSLMKEKKVTNFGGVPYTYKMLRKLGFMEMDLPDLRYFTQAGGKLPLKDHEDFANFAKKNGKKFIVMYGQTEATARMSYLPWEESLRKIGSIGIAIPGGSFSLLDARGEILTKTNQVGELVYEGPNVTMGYAENQTDLALGDERQGRLVTGDMAYVDEEGFYYIVGRKKRFIKMFGNRMNLDEMERNLKEHFHWECALTGEDDTLEIYVVEGAKKEDLEAYVMGKYHLHPSAFSIHSIEEIPKNQAGKTLYGKLKELKS